MLKILSKRKHGLEEIFKTVLSAKNYTHTKKNMEVQQRQLPDLLKFEKQGRERKSLSVELCPKRTLDLEKLKQIDPTFCAITWFFKPLPDIPLNATTVPALALAKKLCNHGYQVVMHLAAGSLKRSEVFDILKEAKRIGIRNILAIKGDRNCYEKGKRVELEHAYDLVKLIKENYNDYFSVGVAAYPDIMTSPNFQRDMDYFKMKVEAGADFIITQAIFNTTNFYPFYEKCQEVGIKVPIIPGFYVFETYSKLQKMRQYCLIKLPKDLESSVESLMNNTEGCMQFSLNLYLKLFKELLMNKVKCVPCVHIFTLNDFYMTLKIRESMSVIM